MKNAFQKKTLIEITVYTFAKIKRFLFTMKN